MSSTNSQVEVCPKKSLSSISCCQQAPSFTIPTCPLVSVSTVEGLAGRKRFTARPPGLFTDNCSRVNTEGVGRQHYRFCHPDENLNLTHHNMLLFHPKFIFGQAYLLSWQKNVHKFDLNGGFNNSLLYLMCRHTQALHTYRINLSPFTKDFRVWGAPIET